MSWIETLTARLPRAGGKRAGATTEAEWITAPPAMTRAGAGFPRFQSTAGDQLDHAAHDNFGQIRVRLRGAYTPVQPVSDRRLFAGRTKVLTSLIRSIEDEKLHAVLYGERGLGKTSLLNVLAGTARDARYRVVFITCGAGSNFDETFRAIADGIPLLFHRQYGPTAPEAEDGATFGSLIGPEPVTVRTASDILAKVDGARVLVILDEFDVARSDEFRRDIAEFLKSLSDRAVRVQVVIAGVLANLTELTANAPSVQRNLAALKIPKMTAAEIRALVKNGEPIGGVVFEDGAVNGVIIRCIGYPYLASMLCHRSALVALEHGRATVSAADVAMATGEAIEEFKSRSSKRAQLRIDEQAAKGFSTRLGLLAQAAQTAGETFTRDDIAALDAGDLAEAASLADALAADGVLLAARDDEFGRTYQFVEDSVAVWLWLHHAQARDAAEG